MMKKVQFLAILTTLIALLSACGSTGEALLTIGEREYSRSALENFEAVTVDYTNKDGETTQFSGVPLLSLLEDAGVTGSGETLVFTAADGYQAEMPMEETLGCQACMVAFDDDSLRLVMPDMSSKLQVKELTTIEVQ